MSVERKDSLQTGNEVRSGSAVKGGIARRPDVFENMSEEGKFGFGVFDWKDPSRIAFRNVAQMIDLGA